MYVKFEIGRKLLKTSGSKQAFLINGDRIASLRSSGMSPHERDKLIIAVMIGTKTSMQSLIILVGTGSPGPDLQGDSIISLRTSSNVAGKKWS